MEGRTEQNGRERRRLRIRWDSLYRGLHLHQQMQGQSCLYPPWNHPPGTVHTAAFWKVAALHPSKKVKVHALERLRLHHCIRNNIESDAAFLTLTSCILYTLKRCCYIFHMSILNVFAPINFLALCNLFFFPQ